MFQSTHSRRVRLGIEIIYHAVAIGFNPRTHEECDGKRRTEPGVEHVSIHALTKSATSRPECRSLTERFQSTHSRRVRRRIPGRLPVGGMFQSTHSRRVRLIINQLIYVDMSFNPRTHEECDVPHTSSIESS